jgi:hypothetical protein
VLRFVIGALVLVIIWYLGNRVFSLFDDSVGRGTSAVLALEQTNGDGVQVSLQQSDWQRGEHNLKMYPGDGVAARSGVHAMLAFFDGSRVRLDQSSEVQIDRSDKVTGQSSTVEFTLKSGRVWVATPNLAVFSGAITRRVSTASYTVEIPADASAMIAMDGITVIKSSGVGLSVHLKNVKAGNLSQVIVGEGQMLILNDDAKRQIAGGADPYSFRDPITADSLKDDFLAKSYAQLSNLVLPTAATVGTGSTAIAEGEDLTLTAPANRQKVSTKSVTVSGKTSQRIRSVLVNSYNAPIKPDRTFTLELALEDEESTLIHVEAQDPQGITLAEADRTVLRELKPFTPVRMTSPVGSGGTLTTALEEIEITGEAPVGTAAIMVNDYKLQLYKPGAKTWSYLASVNIGNLIRGSNVFTIYALDENGRKSTPTNITIVVDPAAVASVTPLPTTSSSAASQPPLKQNAPLTPGTLTVTAPVAGTAAEVTEKEVVIEGTTSANTASISVNGYTLSLYLAGKTTWNYIASVDLTTMKEGKNTYRIVSRNADGEILDVLEYTMTYTK